MSDHDVLAELRRRVGAAFAHELTGDTCVALDLTSEENLFHGLVRHHSDPEKQTILELISRLTGLRKLNLRRNLLRRLPASFAALTQLEHLNLGSNHLGCVPPEIQGFRRLRYLHLGNSDLTALPEFIGDFVELEYLTLHKNVDLRDVSALAPLRKLRSLNLYFLNLGRLPEFIYEFTELTSLTLWNVKEFPRPLDVLSRLEFFTDCGAPGLRELPSGFTRLPRLRMARLFQNNLERLPDDLGRLTTLEQISLYQNQLTSLPDSTGQLTQLAKLNLGWNQFTEIPPVLTQLPALRWLGVFENPLRDPATPRFRPECEVVRERPFASPQPFPTPAVTIR